VAWGGGATKESCWNLSAHKAATEGKSEKGGEA